MDGSPAANRESLRCCLYEAAGMGAQVAVDDDFTRFARPVGFNAIALGTALDIHVCPDEIACFGADKGILHGGQMRIQLATQTNDGLLKV